MFKKFFFVAVLTCTFGCAAFGQNLITNGGFETGDFTGWTQFGDTSFTGVCADADPTTSCSGYTPYDGDWMASFGPISAQGGITQTITTTPGASYLISFYLSNGQRGPDSLDVTFNGVTLVSGTNVGYLHWQLFQFTQVATSNTAALSFAFYQVPDYYDLDDVSVQLVDTPEPASLSLLASAFVAGMALKRRFTHR